MNSSNNLTIEEKIDEILDGLPSAWCDDCRHPRCISKKKSVKQQLLCLIQEERLNELEITMDKWNDTDFDGFIKYASERSEALIEGT